MVDPKAKQYLKTQVQTASPEQLIVMLYDGAIRFCEQAKMNIDSNNREQSCTLIIKAQRIISELLCGLRAENEAKEIAGNLSGLYQYMYMGLINASVDQDKEKIDEIVALLRSLREAWSQAINNLRKEEAGGVDIINRDALSKAQTPDGQSQIERHA